MGPVPLLLTLLATCILPAADTEIPDPVRMRQRIDTHLEAAAALPPTLGLLKTAIALSIDVGAPAYNVGDKDLCADFYQATLTKIVATSRNGLTGSAPAMRGLRAAQDALDRAQALGADAESRAWTLRLAFDLILADWQAERMRGGQLVGLGAQHLRAARIADAAVAFTAALEVYLEVATAEPSDLGTDLRFAPVFAGIALLMVGADDDAAVDAASQGLEVAADLVQAEGFDLRTVVGDVPRFTNAVDRLAAASAKDGARPEAVALVAFLRHFGGEPNGARQALARLRAVVPDHPLVAILAVDAAQPVPEEPAPPRTPAVIP